MTHIVPFNVPKFTFTGPVAINRGNLYNELLDMVLGRYGGFHTKVSGT